MSSKLMKVTTSDGKQLKIPILGLGTFESINVGQIYQTVKYAIDCGYRHFDSAFVYKNEEEIGRALTESIEENKVKREDLFIVSKVWLTYTRPDRVSKCLEKSLKMLNMSYVDLYLVHWPFGFEQQDEQTYPKDSNGLVIEDKTFDLCQTWTAMEELVRKGLTKSIGLSNYNSEQVEQVLAMAQIRPVMNQIEVHPYLTNTKLIEFCKSKGILITAYSPLGGQKVATPGQVNKQRKEVIEDPVVLELAKKYGKTTGQILIRFCIERGLLLVPKTVSKERLVSNMNVWDFELTNEEVKQLETLDCGFRSCDFNVPDIPNFSNYPFKAGIEF